MIVIAIIVSFLYVVLIGSFCLGFNRVKYFKSNTPKPKTRFSIVIPFRNEAKQLPALLESIFSLNYPKELFEVILIDDESDDDSRNVLDTLLMSNTDDATNIKVINTIRTTNSPKKDAISLAISKAKADWIMITDADCILPKYWLNSFDAYIQKYSPSLIVAPVTYYDIKGLLQNFQLLDVLSLQGATIGGFGIKKPFLCNGANLAYTKHLFNSVNGFEGNSEVASGDDVFLLEKAYQNNPNQVHYLKSKQAIVTTKALSTIPELIHQRVRWAAKTSAYKNRFGKIAGSIVFAQNALLIVCLFITLIGALNPKVLLISFLIKVSVDIILISKSAVFFNQTKHLKHYALAAFIYPFFSVYVVIIAVFKGYQWKDRHYQK